MNYFEFLFLSFSSLVLKRASDRLKIKDESKSKRFCLRENFKNEMAQAAIVLREKRRRERRNTLQPDDDEPTLQQQQQQQQQQIENVPESSPPWDVQTTNDKKYRRVGRTFY